MRTRTRPWRVLVGWMAGVVLVGAAATAPAAADAENHDFERVSCGAPQFEGRLPAGMHVDCGLLTVPEDRDMPMAEGNTVVLPVAILRSTGPEPQPDPVVMLNGGPGGGGLEYFLGGVFGGPPQVPDYMAELLKDRDVILVDQRGAGRAEPTTFCASELPGLYEIFGDDRDPVYEKEVLLADMITGCLDDLRASGVDLNHYDTPTIAQDLKALRAVLGLAKWNLYGHSYGGQVALELMRVQRGGLRAVVLDAPVVPYADQWSLAAWAAAAESGFGAIADEYGVAEIEGRLTAIRETFDANPYVTSDPYTAAPLVLTGKDAMHVLHSGMYLPDFIPLLELFMSNLEAYRTPAEFDLGIYLGFPTGVVPTVFDLYFLFFAGLKSDSYAGMVHSIACADQARIMEGVDLATLDADYPYGDMHVDFPDYARLCEQIGVDPIPWGAYQVNRTSTPTLVRQGLLDHVVEPDGSRGLVQRLGPRAQYLEFPAYGHNIQDYGSCSADTLAQFINEPTDLVDTSCITP